MPQNPENPELPEEFEEESPVLLEDYDAQREIDEHPGDELEELRERRSVGATRDANEADAEEQVRVVRLDEDEYR